MKYNSTIRKLSEIKTDILCTFTFQKAGLGLEADALDQALDSQISKTIKHIGYTGEASSVSLIPTIDGKSKQVILIGLGTKKDASQSVFDKAIESSVAAALSKKPKSITFDLSNLSLDENGCAKKSVTKIIDALSSSTYVYDEFKSEKSKATPPSQITFACSKQQQTSIKKAITFATAKNMGMSFTRDLGNSPGNVCTPTFLANTAKSLAKNNANVTCKVLDEKDMEKLNMGAFLSVSKGSTEPGKLIILEYKGTDAKTAPHVLVGKGVTFDTGGISLKPGAQMDEMKYDMCGAASVLGTMKAIIELAPKKNIIGVVAAAENMPAGNASKPGDIVTTASGQTVEILNTDAEGRLVLCDALTYVERFKPKSVIDIATLTGACIVALGHSTSAVMSNSDEFAQTLLNCGTEANDKAWQLPIWDEYQKQIDSPFADMQNIGGKGAGSITAACFLARFTKQYTWAHLDIAGTAWISGANKGATGRPVPLLLNYLINHAK